MHKKRLKFSPFAPWYEVLYVEAGYGLGIFNLRRVFELQRVFWKSTGMKDYEITEMFDDCCKEIQNETFV